MDWMLYNLKRQASRMIENGSCTSTVVTLKYSPSPGKYGEYPPISYVPHSADFMKLLRSALLIHSMAIT